jgi:FKBP-type peptidyl-prolyl cis-trans isomerase
MKLLSPATLLVSAFMLFSVHAQEAQPSTESPGLKDKEKSDANKQSRKNKIESEDFLAKNAKAEGIKVLPDGLQYRVIREGTGAIPATNDLVFVKYRGRRLDGTEFGRHDRFLTRMDGGIQGWQEALQRMKVGSKLELFVPAALAFGDEGEEYLHIEPGSAVIYELELVSIAPPNPEFGRGLGHAFDLDTSPTPGNK